MAQRTSVQFLTRTAILLALALLFQFYGGSIAAVLGLPAQFVVGPLVNLCLLVATAISGVWSGVLIGLLTPVTATLTGHITVPLPLIPVIVVGNLILVVAFWLFDRRAAGKSAGPKLGLRSAGLLAGALVKCGVLWGATALFAQLAWLPAKSVPALLVAFGWLQAVTALIGGALALVVLVPIEAAVPKTKKP